MPTKAKLSKRSVDAAPKPAKGEERLWDTELAGFCLRTYSTGRKVFALKYRVGTRQRWANIGVYGQPWSGPSGNKSDALTAEEARKEAEFIRGAAVGGEDASQKASGADPAATVSQLIDRYLKDGPATKPKKRKTSWDSDGSNLRLHVKPLIGSKRVTELTRSDVARMVKAITDGETAREVTKTKLRGRSTIKGGVGAAARALSATSAMLNWGIEHGTGTENPAKGIKLAKRPAKERFLSPEEAIELLAKLAAMEAAGEVNKAHAAVIRLLLLTGARRSEITGLRWSEVDFTRKRLRLPPDRTKSGGNTGDRRIALNTAAIDVLKEQPRPEKAVFVFPAGGGKSGVVGIYKSWLKVRKAANLPDVRLHDLRHSFASFAIADGASLYLIGKALGHADSRTTERYAHLADDPLQALAEAAGKRMTGTPTGESKQ